MKLFKKCKSFLTKRKKNYFFSILPFYMYLNSLYPHRVFFCLILFSNSSAFVLTVMFNLGIKTLTKLLRIFQLNSWEKLKNFSFSCKN